MVNIHNTLLAPCLAATRSKHISHASLPGACYRHARCLNFDPYSFSHRRESHTRLVYHPSPRRGPTPPGGLRRPRIRCPRPPLHGPSKPASDPGCPRSMKASAAPPAAPTPFAAEMCPGCFAPRWWILLPDGVLDLVLQRAGLCPWQPGHKGWQGHPRAGGAGGKLLLGIRLRWRRLLLFLCHRCWRGGREAGEMGCV